MEEGQCLLERKLVPLPGFLAWLPAPDRSTLFCPLQIFLKVKFRPIEYTGDNSEFSVTHQIGIMVYEQKPIYYLGLLVSMHESF